MLTHMATLTSWAITLALYSAALGLAAWLIPGVRIKGGIKGVVVVTVIFGVINLLIAWLLKFLFGVATLGLGFVFATVTNALVTAIVLKLTDKVSDLLFIKTFWRAVAVAVVMSMTVNAARHLLKL